MSSGSTVPNNNTTVLNISPNIKHVMSSATEAELAALYIVAREAVYIRRFLEELSWKFPGHVLDMSSERPTVLKFVLKQHIGGHGVTLAPESRVLPLVPSLSHKAEQK